MPIVYKQYHGCDELQYLAFPMFYRRVLLDIMDQEQIPLGTVLESIDLQCALKRGVSPEQFSANRTFFRTYVSAIDCADMYDVYSHATCASERATATRNWAEYYCELGLRKELVQPTKVPQCIPVDEMERMIVKHLEMMGRMMN